MKRSTYYALSCEKKEAVWIKRFINELILLHPSLDDIPLEGDNKTNIFLTNDADN